MRRQTMLVLAVALLGGVALVATGCGSKKKASSTTTTTTAAQSQSTSSTTSTTATTTPTSTTPVSGLGLLTSKNCASLLNLSQAFGQALTGAGQNLDKSAKVFQDFANQTPEEIRPDFKIIATAFAKVAEALKGVNLTSGSAPSPEVMARLQKLGTEINSADVSAASARISAWAGKNCKK